jgi:DNA repair protein RAD16
MDGLEYDELEAEIEESDDSGSEFVESSEDEPMPLDRDGEELETDLDMLEDDNEDVDYKIMLDAATLESMQGPNIASSSSSRLTSANPAAILRARAAEARIAAAQRGVDNAVDDSQMVVDDSDLSSVPDSDAEVPLAKRKAPAGKGKKKVTVRDTPKKGMTMKEMRAQRRKARLEAKLAKRENHLEEMALRKELGRKLTYVRTFSKFPPCAHPWRRLKNLPSPCANTTLN